MHSDTGSMEGQKHFKAVITAAHYQVYAALFHFPSPYFPVFSLSLVLLFHYKVLCSKYPGNWQAAASLKPSETLQQSLPNDLPTQHFPCLREDAAACSSLCRSVRSYWQYMFLDSNFSLWGTSSTVPNLALCLTWRMLKTYTEQQMRQLSDGDTSL